MNDVAAPAAETTAVPAEPAANPMRKIILILLAVLLVLFAYHVLSDRFTPYTSQARVDAFMTQIAPQVSGNVLEVPIKDNSHVQKGQLLFRIDPEPYQIALRSAEADLSVALQGADVSAADVVAARAAIAKQRADLHASRQINNIITDLVSKNALPKTQEIRSTSDVGKTEADLARSVADLRKAEANLGSPGLQNSKVRQALAALDQAKLNLRNTRVVAPATGTVTNLRLAVGQYVTPGAPVLSFLESGARWISADLRENQLGNVKPGQDVTVALDVQPGKLFHGKVHSIGGGISQGDEAPVGQLETVQAPQGWIRQPQRFPVRIQLVQDGREKPQADARRSGAQANVIIFTSDKSLMNPIGRVWIKLITLLSYLQ